MKFEMYQGKDNELYFRLVENSGKILLSSEGYKLKDSAMNGIESVKKNLTLPNGIEKKETPNGKYFFNVKSTNGQVVGTSTMFDSVEQREKWINDIKKEALQLEVKGL